LASSAAHAQSPDQQAKAIADALFDDGRKLMADGKTPEACAKFEASIEALPQLGARMNLAQCYEKLGRTASAYVEWREVVGLAAKTKDPREQFARERLDALGPTVMRLTIQVTEPDVSVKLDGIAIPRATFGTGIPVDPGAHQLVATAPGKPDWSSKIDVEGLDDVHRAAARRGLAGVLARRPPRARRRFEPRDHRRRGRADAGRNVDRPRPGREVEMERGVRLGV